MSSKRALAIVLRQFYLLRGSPVRLLPLFAGFEICEVLIHQLKFARAAQDVDLHGTPIPALRAEHR